MAELAFRTARALLEDLAAGRVTSRELLELYLERVDAQGTLNAIVTLDAERARDAADAADEARAAGRPLGPLHGLPITVKDCFETAGLRTTCGVPELSEHVPEADAVAVARLRAAGAVIFGKSNTPPWAGDWQTDNPVFGRTLNPWDATRSPGGSSGGSAAAIAAGLCALELGSDVGGSIRVPSHWSGVCGHKPSHGIVPQRGHLPGPPGSRADADLNTVGPIARCVDDLALMLDVIAGPEPARARGWRLELPPAPGARLADFRVGAWLDDPAFPVEGEMRAVIEAALDELRGHGADVRPARPRIDLAPAVLDYLDLLMPLNTRAMTDEERDALGDLPEFPRGSADLFARSVRGLGLRHADWLAADERRLETCARWEECFCDFDVVVCPVTLGPAIEHDERPFPERRVVIDGKERPYLELIAWPGVVSMAGLPSTVIPLGRTRAGLPVGAQMVGAHLTDRTTLAFARAAEAVLGGYAPPPAFAGA